MKLNPDDFGWVIEQAAYSEAGCLTLVAGVNAASALALIGCDLGQVDSAEGLLGWPTIAGATLHDGAGSSSAVLIEDNHGLGLADAALRALSRKGKAASVSWDVNDLVLLGCARRGKVVYLNEIDADSEGLPPRLARIAATANMDASLVTVALTMACAFTGISVAPTQDVLSPTRWHPVTRQLLDLPVKLEELVALDYPSSELVRQVCQVDEADRWRLAEWAVTRAVEAAAIAEHPAVVEILAQHGRSRPTATTPALERLRAELDRWPADLELALNVGRATAEQHSEADRRGRAMWAMNAISYTLSDDSTTAALGAAYCLTCVIGLDNADPARRQALGLIS